MVAADLGSRLDKEKGFEEKVKEGGERGPRATCDGFGDFAAAALGTPPDWRRSLVYRERETERAYYICNAMLCSSCSM